MDKILRLLRDPVWQAIGTFVAVIALIVTIAVSPQERAVLSIYHAHKIKFEEYWLPTDQIRLVLLGSKDEISHAVVDYYTIINDSNKPILAGDFSSPVTITKGEKTERIFLVSSCSTLAADQPQDQSRTKVALNWTRVGDKWRAEPTLFNPGDYACITVISEETTAQEKAAPAHRRFAWDGRIVNVQVRTFDSAEDYAKTRPQSWTNYMQAVVVLTGFMPYWFVGLQVLLFVATMTLAREASWISGHRSFDLLKTAFVVVLSTGSAESLISVFAYLSLKHLHPAVLLFVAIHLLLAIYLARRAKRHAQTPPTT